MNQDLDLEQLQKVAEAEETREWGSWAFEDDDWAGFSVYINDGDNVGRSYVAERMTQGESEGESTARYIATFDPPTVLALLSRVKEAEQKSKERHEVIQTLSRIIETQSETVLEATESHDLIWDKETLDGDWSAIWDRVTEYCTGYKELKTKLAEAEAELANWKTTAISRGEHAEKAEQQAARVRELHSSIPIKINFDEHPTDFCKHCDDSEGEYAKYPCPTIRVLDGEL